MDKVTHNTESLLEAIKESSVYERYQNIKEEIDQEPDLKEQLCRFRIHNYHLQNSNEKTDMFAEMERFEREYEQFQKNPLIAAYLRKELELCRMVQRIHLRLIEAVNIDIEGMEEEIH